MEKEFYEEYEDMEAGIDQKQALVEESKKVDEIEDFNEAVRFVNDLKKKLKSEDRQVIVTTIQKMQILISKRLKEDTPEYQKIKNLKNKKDTYGKIEKELINLEEMNELLLLEDDDALSNDLLNSSKKIDKEIEKLELATLLSGKYDSNNAIITLHPGARRNRISRLG